MTGKTVRISVAYGEPIGVLFAEISTGAGEVLVAPRSQHDQPRMREMLRCAGVYPLFGSVPDDPSRTRTCIDESDHVLRGRLSTEEPRQNCPRSPTRCR